MKRLNPLIFIFVLIFPMYLYAKVVPYQEIDKILKETWDSTYPVPYTRIVKKDILGKGIIKLKKKKSNYYLYTFILFVPRYILVDGKPVPAPNNHGRKIPVNLFYYPGESEKPYKIKIGEITGT